MTAPSLTDHPALSPVGCPVAVLQALALAVEIRATSAAALAAHDLGAPGRSAHH